MSTTKKASKGSNGNKGSNGAKAPKGSSGGRTGAEGARRAQDKIAATQEKIAAAGGVHIGDIISWNADKVDAPRAEARAVFAVANLESLITDIAPGSALTRAVAEGSKPRDMIVRAFDAPSGAPLSFGIYQQRGRTGEAGDDFACGARVRVEMSGAIVALPPEGSAGIAEALAYAEDIAARANHLLSHCVSRDISAALVELSRKLCALPLRDRGGFYLLPPATCATWTALTPGLRALGFRPIAIRMHDCAENVATMSEAAQGALEGELEELLADLAKAKTDGMRTDVLERRISLCDDLTAKADLYRGVLCDVADRIQGEIKALHDAFQAKLDADAAAAAAGRPVHTPEVAAKLSSAASKAWATRRAAALAASSAVASAA